MTRRKVGYQLDTEAIGMLDRLSAGAGQPKQVVLEGLIRAAAASYNDPVDQLKRIAQEIRLIAARLSVRACDGN